MEALAGRILAEVKEFQEKTHLPDIGKAFIAWYLLNIDGLPETELEGVMTDGARDTGVDAIYFDDETSEIIIFQGKFSESDSPVSLEEISKTLETANLLRDGGPLSGNRKVKGRLIAARERLLDTESQWTLRTKLITNKLFAQDVIERYESDPNVDLIDLEAITKELKPDTIESPNIKTFLKVVPEQFFLSTQAGKKVVVCTVLAKDLAQIYKESGRKLFWRNVRFDLGRSKPVNKGIAQTLQDRNQRDSFWLFNNGVTILCDRFHMDKDHATIELENISIINGAQTTSTLAAESPHLRDSVQLLVKIIQIPEEDDNLVRSIVQYTNKQTATVSQDFIANDKAQIALQEQFKKRGYFYDLKRGLWEILDTKEKRTLKRLKINDLAYAVLAFHGRPGEARNAKRLYFEKDKGGHYDFIFNEDRSIDEFIFIYELSNASKQSIAEMKEQKPNEGFGYLAAFLIAVAGSIYRSLISERLSYEKFCALSVENQQLFLKQLLLSASYTMQELIRIKREKTPELDLDNFSKSTQVNEVSNQADANIHPRDKDSLEQFVTSLL